MHLKITNALSFRPMFLKRPVIRFHFLPRWQNKLKLLNDGRILVLLELQNKMDISLSLHPFEIARHLRLFWQVLLSDLELRYPETRRRYGLEIERSLTDEEKKTNKNFILQLTVATHPISFLDWNTLFEIHERIL